MIAVGASISLLASGCETTPHAAPARGVILGKVNNISGIVSVEAISEDGRTHRARVRSDGTYQFKPLPLGSYSLTFVTDCGSFDGDRVILQEREHVVGMPTKAADCIIIGMAKIEENLG